MRIVLGLTMALVLGGCGWADRLGLARETSDASLPYSAQLNSGDEPRDFTVTVEAPAGTPVNELRESVRFPATRYCIETFGASDADWTIDETTGDWQYTVNETGDALTFSGRCTAR